MKIGLLASTGAGKTSHLAGLYGVLTKTWNADADYGVSFAMTDSAQQKKFGALFAQLRKGHDFKPSTEITKYTCTLTAWQPDNTPCILNIEMVDFPGEAIEGAKSEEDKERTAEIIAELSWCDGFIVLVDGEQFVQGVLDDDVYQIEDTVKSDEIRNVLHKAIDIRRERIKQDEPEAHAFGHGKLPIAFAFTKGDKIKAATQSQEQKKALDDFARRNFVKSSAGARRRERALASYITKNFKIFIDDVEIATLITLVHNYEIGGNKFSPLNLEKPFQFVMFVGLLNAVKEYERRINVWDEEFGKKDAEYQEMRRKYEVAKAEYERRARMNYVDKINALAGNIQKTVTETLKKNNSVIEKVDDLVENIGYTSTNKLLKKMNETVDPANQRAEERDATLLTRKKTFRNHAITKLLSERILSDEMVYCLDSEDSSSNFYRTGLPIAALRAQEWWRNKSEKGREEEQRKEPNEADFYVHPSGGVSRKTPDADIA